MFRCGPDQSNAVGVSEAELLHWRNRHLALMFTLQAWGMPIEHAHQRLPTHTTSSSTVSTAPPHLHVLRHLCRINGSYCGSSRAGAVVRRDGMVRDYRMCSGLHPGFDSGGVAECSQPRVERCFASLHPWKRVRFDLSRPGWGEGSGGSAAARVTPNCLEGNAGVSATPPGAGRSTRDAIHGFRSRGCARDSLHPLYLIL